MKKNSIQGIINFVLLAFYIAFVIIYSKQTEPIIEHNQAYIMAYFVMISVILISKYVIYKRREMLYFALIFVSYILIMLIHLDNFDILLNNNFGLFVLFPGIISLIFWINGRSSIHFRFGLFTLLLGIILLIFFNIL